MSARRHCGLRGPWRWLAALALLLCGVAAAPAQEGAAPTAQEAVAPAEEVIAALSRTRVAITTSFTGSEILVFGAVKRSAPIRQDAPLDVIVTVTGPSGPVEVRRKERQFGIWINGRAVTVDAAPSFYAVATTRPFREVISHTEDLRQKVGLDHAVKLIGDSYDTAYPEDFVEAVVRLRKAEGLYFEQIGGVTLREQTLFHASVALPAKLVEGNYRARVLLMRDRALVDSYETVITVRKEGLERWLYAMANEQPALYGIASIVIALLAGWLASALFRFFFP